MPRVRLDKHILKEHQARCAAFAESGLTPESAERIYNYLNGFQYDTGGWQLYDAAKKILKTDVYSQFPTEDNLGQFEESDGTELAKWLTIAKFADKEYEQLSGGYEKLSNFEVDKDKPEYQEYKKALYREAVLGIAGKLAERPNHPLDVFWGRLSYIQSTLENAQPTKADLMKRVDDEYFEFMKKGDGELAYTKNAMAGLRDVLHNTPMSDEMIQALMCKHNVLEDAFNDYFNNFTVDNYYDAADSYLKMTERDYLADRLYDRVLLAHNRFIEMIKDAPPAILIDEAYKITVMDEIKSWLEPYPVTNLSMEQLKGLMSFDEPLWDLYNEWQKRDCSLSEALYETIIDAAYDKAEKMGLNVYYQGYNELDNEAGDGQEI